MFLGYVGWYNEIFIWLLLVPNHHASIYSSLCSTTVKSKPPSFLHYLNKRPMKKLWQLCVTEQIAQNGSNASTVPTCPMWFWSDVAQICKRLKHLKQLLTQPPLRLAPSANQVLCITGKGRGGIIICIHVKSWHNAVWPSTPWSHPTSTLDKGSL